MGGGVLWRGAVAGCCGGADAAVNVAAFRSVAGVHTKTDFFIKIYVRKAFRRPFSMKMHV